MPSENHFEKVKIVLPFRKDNKAGNNGLKIQEVQE